MIFGVMQKCMVKFYDVMDAPDVSNTSHSFAHLTAYPAQTSNYCIYLVSDLLQ